MLLDKSAYKLNLGLQSPDAIETKDVNKPEPLGDIQQSSDKSEGHTNKVYKNSKFFRNSNNALK